jgi:hypothetical protein
MNLIQDLWCSRVTALDCARKATEMSQKGYRSYPFCNYDFHLIDSALFYKNVELLETIILTIRKSYLRTCL